MRRRLAAAVAAALAAGLLVAPAPGVAQTTGPALSVDDGTGNEYDECTDAILLTFVEFPLRLTSASDRPVTAAFEVLFDGTAAAADLHGPLTGEITLPAGQTETTIRIEIAPDDRFESDERFTLRLTGGEGATIADGQASGTIVDNETSETVRLAGSSRYQTAVAVGLSSPGVLVPPESAVIASGADFADALAAAPLASEPGSGGLLLSTPDVLHPATRRELEMNTPRRVFMVGGPRALSERVRRDIGAVRGVEEVIRIDGTNRFDTARQIALRVGGRRAYVASGQRFADAVAVSALAAYQRRPLLLTAGDRLPAETVRAVRELGVAQATIVGGTATVSATVADELRRLGVTVSRVAGADRYRTSRAVAELAIDAGMEPDKTWLVTGRDWPDALVAGPAAAIGCLGHRAPGILLLVDGQSLSGSPTTRAWLQERSGAFTRVWLVGGGAAITAVVEAQVRQLSATR